MKEKFKCQKKGRNHAMGSNILGQSSGTFYLVTSEKQQSRVYLKPNWKILSGKISLQSDQARKAIGKKFEFFEMNVTFCSTTNLMITYVITAWILKLSQYIVLWMKVNILLLYYSLWNRPSAFMRKNAMLAKKGNMSCCWNPFFQREDQLNKLIRCVWVIHIKTQTCCFCKSPHHTR